MSVLRVNTGLGKINLTRGERKQLYLDISQAGSKQTHAILANSSVALLRPRVTFCD